MRKALWGLVLVVAFATGVASAQVEEPSRTVYLKVRGSDVMPYRIVLKKSCWPGNEDQIGAARLVKFESERIVFTCTGY